MRGRAAEKGRAEARARFGKLVEEEQAEPQADVVGGVPDLGQGARGQRVGDVTSRESGRMEALRRWGTEDEKAAVEQMSPTKVTHTKYVPDEHRLRASGSLPPRPQHPGMRTDD